MAGKAPSRLKSEKAHLSKPYEKPKSILKKVASTVKDLLLPSWLTSSAWSVDTEIEEAEQNNGPCAADDGTRHRENAVLEEGNVEVPEAPTFSRRDREAPFEASRDGFDCSFVPREVPVRIPSASTPVHRSARGADGAVLLNGDNHSENSEGSGSTSGCSSLVPSLRQRDAVTTPAACSMSGLTLSEAALERLRQDLSSRRDFGVNADPPPQLPAALDTRQDKLWSESTNADVSVGQLRTRASGKYRPSFTLSALSPPTPTAAKRKTESPYRSLFYEGRTTYGGASAYKRFSLVNRSSAYGSEQQEQSSCTVVNTQKRARQDVDFVCMSSTTQRILESLEKASTPLSEAKKVPLNRGSRDPILSYVPLSQRRRMALREVTQPVRGPPNTSFSRPITVRLEKNLDSILAQKSATSVPKNTPQTPTKAQAVPPMRERVPVTYSAESCSQEEHGRGGGKMRAQVVEHHRPSARRGESEEVVQVPDLPSVPLPITTLPSFDFRPLAPPTLSSKATTVAASCASSPTKVESSDYEFQFSAPIYQERKNVGTSVPPVEFSFSKPVLLDAGGKFGGSPAIETSSSSPAPAKRKTPSKSDLSNSEVEEGGFKAAAQLILGGSVMDILGKSSAKTSEGSSSLSSTSITESASGSSEPAKSVFGHTLATASPAKSTPAVSTTFSTPAMVSSSGFSDKFKPPPSSWECDTCLVRNTGNAKKCVACETPKPGAKPATKPATATGFGDKFKPAANTWECGTCMVRNKGEDVKCIACETPKPGAASGPAAGKPATPFKFGIPSGSSAATTATTDFKFGISPTASVASSQSMGFQLAFASSAKQSAPPTFKFGVPVTATESTSPTSTAAKVNFGGVPSTVKEPAIAGTAPLKPAEALDSPAVKMTAKTSASDLALGKGGLAPFSSPSDTTFKFGTASTPEKEHKDNTEESRAKKPFAFESSSVTKDSPFSFTPQKPKSATQGFTFGSSANSSEPAASAGALVTTTVPAKASETSGGFSFTSATETAKASAVGQKGDSAGNKGLFSFGTPSSKPAENTTLAGIKFGDATKKAEDANGSPFPFGKTEPMAEKAGFAFGSLVAAKSEKSTSEKGGFNFTVAPLSNTMTSTADATKSAFSFSAGAKKDDTPKSGFVFGGATAAPTKPTFTFGTPPASEPATAAAATTAPKFVFGQKSDPTPGTFTFGSQPAAVTTAPTSAFSFKAPCPSTTTAPSQPTGFGAKTEKPLATPFGFGGTPAVAPSAAPPAVFSFGAPKNDPSPAAPQPAAPVFSFGASTPSQAPAAGAAAPPSAQAAFSFGASQPSSTATAQGFKFGGASSTPAATPFGSGTSAAPAGTVAPPAANTGFNFPVASPFGANQSQAAATASPFGASQPQATASTPFGSAQSQATPSLFGANTGQAGGASTSGFSFRPPAPSPAPTFQFGGSAPGTQEVFRFGAQVQSQEAQPQQPGAFNFNPPVAGAAPVFGQQVAAPAFNFNAAAPVASPGGFPFQANTDNPFSATGSGALAGRKIRKAVRRKPPLQR